MILKSLGRFARLLTNWYRTKTGLVYGLALVAAAAIALLQSSQLAAILVLGLALGVVIPARLQSLSGQISTLKGRQGSTRSRLKSQGSAPGERQKIMEEIEVVRQEARDLIRSERLSWRGAIADIEGVLAEFRGAEYKMNLPDGTTLTRRIGDVSLRLARLRPPIETSQVVLIIGGDDRCSASLYTACLGRGDIALQPLADIHRSLQLVGRRVPSHVDLFENGPEVVDIELAPSVGAAVGLPNPATTSPIAVIEFVDPATFSFDVERFVNRLPVVLDRYERVSLVLPVSRPDPAANSHSSRQSPLAIQAATLEAQRAIAETMPAYAVDGRVLETNPRATLSSLFSWLFPNENPGDRDLASAMGSSMISIPHGPLGQYKTPERASNRLLRVGLSQQELELLDDAQATHSALLAR